MDVLIQKTGAYVYLFSVEKSLFRLIERKDAIPFEGEAAFPHPVLEDEVHVAKTLFHRPHYDTNGRSKANFRSRWLRKGRASRGAP